MIRAAGYRVVLADFLPEVSSLAAGVFDKIYTLQDDVQRALLRGRFRSRMPEPDDEIRPMEVERPTKWKSYLWRLLQGALRGRRLQQVVVREHPGLIHFQSMSAGGMTCYYWLKRLGWPARDRRPGLLTHLWGYAPRFPGIRRREIRALKEFDHIHTSSPAVSRLYREHYQVPSEQISVFVRGINLKTFWPRGDEELAAARAEWGVPADKFVIIHNRHLHPMYRVDVAVDAFIEVARRGHDVFLMLVRGSMCDPEYERSLRGRLEQAGLAEHVALMPLVLSASEMAVALQLADCSINTVPFDAFPVSILEAMYCGAVPVVRNLESYSQFIKDGATAFAVDGEADVYADRLERLVVDRELRDRMAGQGRALVEAEGSEEIFRRKTLELVESCWHEW
jgi:glycosyltransferase involved in cell wall biosynthesis